MLAYTEIVSSLKIFEGDCPINKDSLDIDGFIFINFRKVSDLDSEMKLIFQSTFLQSVHPETQAMNVSCFTSSIQDKSPSQYLQCQSGLVWYHHPCTEDEGTAGL